MVPIVRFFPFTTAATPLFACPKRGVVVLRCFSYIYPLPILCHATPLACDYSSERYLSVGTVDIAPLAHPRGHASEGSCGFRAGHDISKAMNSKITTAFGLCAAIGAARTQCGYPGVGTVLLAIGAGGTGISARDNNKTSEDAGAK